jgi:colanic acid biosynthesis glycosyl transferase WcaI
MLGLVSDEVLERELTNADIAFVSQRYDGSEFNIPSKLMNFMAYGLPILAAVNPAGEVARIVRSSQSGWIVDSSDPNAFPREVQRISEKPAEIRLRAERSRDWAQEHFTRVRFAERFEETLLEAAGSRCSDSARRSRCAAAEA